MTSTETRDLHGRRDYFLFEIECELSKSNGDIRHMRLYELKTALAETVAAIHSETSPNDVMALELATCGSYEAGQK